MKINWKKVVSLLMALTLLTGMCSVPVNADEASENGAALPVSFWDTAEECVMNIDNAGFEESGEEVPGWALLSGKVFPVGKLDTTDAEAYSGNYSLKITVEDAEDTAYSSGIFGVRDGFTYTASAMMKGDLTPSITLKFYNMYSMECASATVPGTVCADWTEMTVSAVAPSGAVFARVLVGGAGTGDLYVDEASLVQMPLIKNADFAEGIVGWTEEEGYLISDAITAQAGLTYLLVGNCESDGAECALVFKNSAGEVLQQNDATAVNGEEVVLRGTAPVDSATLQVKINAQTSFSNLCLESTPYGTQVPDGSFENLKKGIGTSWTFKNTTAENAFTGVLITDGVTGVKLTQTASLTSDLIPVLGGKEYIATIDARSTTVGGARFRVITYGRGGGVSAGYDVYTTAANTNEKLQIRFVPNRNAVNARVILYGQSGISQYDNAQVYAISDSISNYSFEDVNAYNKVGNFAKQWQVLGDIQALTVSDPGLDIPSSAMAAKVNGFGEGSIRSSMVRVEGNKGYTARILASSEKGGSVRIAFYNDKFVRLTAGEKVPFSGNIWTKYTATGLAPTGTAYAVLEICADKGDSFVCDAAEFSQTVLDVEDNTQMFIDDYVIESTDLTRTLHQAEKTDVILDTGENRWDKNGSYIYGSVLYDEQEGIYKMWYQVLNQDYRGIHGGDAKACMAAYATSTDGVNWEKPNLGLVEYDGITDHNIIGNYHIQSVFKDMEEEDPAKRYKMITYTHDVNYTCLYSADGLVWTKESSIEGGDVITAAYSKSEDLYVSYVKQGLSGKRDQFTMISTGKLGEWSEPIASPANSDIIDSKNIYLADSYGMGFYEKDGNYIGFNWVFDIPGSNIMEGTIEPQLSYSRDLKEDWQRPSREALIPLRENGAVDDGCIVTASSAIEVGDEVWMYTGCMDNDHHGDTPGDYRTYISKWRMDGFMSMNGTGTLTTKPMKVDYAELLLNADASKGSIKAELLDASGNPIPGFTKDDFNTITTDSVEHRLTWGDSNVASLAGQSVKLNLYSENSEIYSFRFSGTVPLEAIDVEDKVMVKAGETVQLNVTAVPETAELEAPVWTSSNSNVATVDNNGVITAVAPGIAVITVSTNGKSADCVVTVTEAETGLTGPTLSWSLLYEQDFEDEADTTFAAAQGIYGAVNTKVTRDMIDGTYASHIKGSNTSTVLGYPTYAYATSSKTIGTINDAGLGIDKGCVAQFDVYKVSDGLPITAYWRSEYLSIYNAVGLPTSNFPENNRWYTVTIESSGNYWRDSKAGKVWVSIKDNVTGEVFPGTYYNSYAPFASASCFGFICDPRVAGGTKAASFGDLGYIKGSGTVLENAAATDYYIDNVKIYNRTAVDTKGVNLYLDWDSLRGYGTHKMTAGNTITKHSVLKEADGNTYRTIEALADANQYMNFPANGDNPEMGNGDFTIAIDVVKLNEGDSLHVGYNSGVINPENETTVYTYGYAIPACTLEKDVWYSYRIVRKDGVMTAYRKTRDGNDPFVEVGVEAATNTKYQVKYGTRIPVLYTGGSYTNTNNTVSNFNNSLWLYCPKNKPVNRPALGCTGEATVAGTKWGYDNIVVTEGNAMTVESITLAGDANSSVTKVALRTADAVAGILPVIGYYDANNRLMFVDYDAEVNYDATDISSGWSFTSRDSDGTESRENYLGTIGAGGFAKAFIWNSAAAAPLVDAIDVTAIVK